MNLNVRFATALAVLIILWFFSGLFVSGDAEDTVAEEKNVDLTKVEAQWFNAQSYQPNISLRAKTEAHRSVELKAQVPGRITAVPIPEGSRVESGATICEIDEEDRPLRVIQARASVEQAEIEYKGALRLKKSGYQSEVAIAQTKARLEAARADLKRSQLDVDNLQVKAPFNGIVESRPVEVGDYVQPGQLCARFIELDPLKVSALVTEKEVIQLSPGDAAKMALVTGQVIEGRVSFIARQADAVTRSYRVEATIANAGEQIRAGISGRLSLLTAAVDAHLIPSHLVVLDDRGGLIVRAVEDAKVTSWPVRPVGENSGGIWVTGLPERVALVTVGQNYITNGEQVEVFFTDDSQRL